MLLAVAAACAGETVEVPGETVVVEKEVIKEVMVPGETVVVEKIVTETVEVPGETVVQEVVKTVEVPGQTVVVEKEVVKTVEVPGQTVVVEKVVVQEVAGKNYVTDPSTGEIVEAPQYGGTLTYGRSSLGEHTDVWFIGGFAQHWISVVLETLVIADWAFDRSVNDLRTYDLPESMFRGALAESWETPDTTTIIAHIRPGVYWHDKAPMNGRELTANDVEFNFHRLCGLGSGFTEASPVAGGVCEIVESVTATDDRTVVFKVTRPDAQAVSRIFDDSVSFIYPPEVIRQHGDLTDWRNLVGTGPMELTDVVEGASLKWTRVSDYWGFDEKFPQNRLPYIDELRMLLMPDQAARLAALRSGKVDVLGTAGDSQLKSIDQVKSLRAKNPEINIWNFKFRSANAFIFNNVNNPPFNDIRVRRAMQMALDLETISETFFSGLADPTPQGMMDNSKIGVGTPFEEWPEEIKRYYRYDPEGAKLLLAEAGYPDGFTTRVDYWEGYDINYAELASNYWREIGVEVEVHSVDGTRALALVRENTSDGMMHYLEAVTYEPRGILPNFTTDHTWNGCACSDPEYDELWGRANAATTLEEQSRWAKAANMRVVEQQWRISGPRSPQFNVAQPWVKGYNGEVRLGRGNISTVLTRVWIDQELKEAMGH